MQIVPVLFTFDKYYVVAAEVAIFSLLKNASPTYQYNLYVLYRNLPTKSQRKLKSIVQKFQNAAIEFIDMTSLDYKYSDLPSKKHFSKEIFYKLTAAEIFSQYDRILCSDVDVVFTGDISPSFFMFENEPFYFAGVGQIIKSTRMDTYKQDFSKKEQDILKYEINAGFLLINLKEIREKSMQKTLTDFYLNNFHRTPLPEQDTLTLCCWPALKFLPAKYNIYNYYNEKDIDPASLTDEFVELNKEENPLSILKDALAHPIMIHFVGVEKPWNSWGIPKQEVWNHYLKDSGCFFDYLLDLPIQLNKRLKRLSLRRFLRKLFKKI